METEEQKKQHKYLIAESFASLSIGLWAVSLIGYLTSGITWATYCLAVVGVISALFGIYLILPWDWKQNQSLEYLERSKIIIPIKLLGWLSVLAAFGVNLIQTKVVWLILAGLIVIIIALIVFYVGIWRMNKNHRKPKHV